MTDRYKYLSDIDYLYVRTTFVENVSMIYENAFLTILSSQNLNLNLLSVCRLELEKLCFFSINFLLNELKTIVYSFIRIKKKKIPFNS
jgi:hypothetical protein